MLARQIEAFRAMMLTQTVVGAAELLRISQPAVSRIIARLEAELGLTLFDRSSGRLLPTPEAVILYPEVEKLTASASRIRRIVSDLRSVRTGTLRLAALPAIGMSFLPDVVRDFAVRHSGVAIVLEIQSSAEIEERIGNQQLDLGIMELPVSRTGIAMEIFCETSLVAVLPPGHPLAAQAQLGPADLAALPLISLMPEQTSQNFIDAAFQAAGHRPSAIITTQNNALICEMVLRGLGAGLVDPFTAEGYRRLGLAITSFQPAIKFRAGVLYPTHRHLARPAKSFLSMLRARKIAFLAAATGSIESLSDEAHVPSILGAEANAPPEPKERAETALWRNRRQSIHDRAK